MSGSVNATFLVGRVGKDPELRFFPSGDAVASLSVATSERWSDKSGEKKERTDWHRVEVFGKAAQFCRDWVVKGALISVEGSIRYDTYKDKDGHEKHTTKIRAQRVELLSKPSGERAERQPEPHEPANLDPSGDDIPFGWLLPVVLPLLGVGALFT